MPESMLPSTPPEPRLAGGDGTSPGRSAASGGRRRRAASILGAVLLAAWAVVVASAFVRGQGLLSRAVASATTTFAPLVLVGYSVWLAGWRIRRRIVDSGRVEWSRLERHATEIGLGLAAVMLATFVLGVAGLLHPGAAWVVVGLPWIGPHRPFWRDLAAMRPARGAGTVFLWAALLVTAGLTLLASLAPPTSQDALVYHLAVPRKWIADGSIGYVEGNFYSAFPMNVELLFTLGLLLDSPSLAKWFHWLLGVGAAVVTAALALRVMASRGMPRRATAVPLLAAALFATIPTAALIAGWAYVDLGVVFFTLLSIDLLIVSWRVGRDAADPEAERTASRLLVLAAAFAGVAAGCKYTAGSQGIFLVGFLVLSGLFERRSWRAVARRVGVAIGVMALVAGPWYLKNWWQLGNPVFPFAYGIFGGADWDAERARILAISLSEWGGSRSGWGILTLPWDLTTSGAFFSPEHFDGVVGAAFLFGLPLLCLGVRVGEEYRVALFFLIVHCLFWVVMTHQVRFLLPALAIASALIAVGAAASRARAVRLFAGGGLRFAIAANVILVSIHFSSHDPLPVVLGLESEEHYLQREVPGGDYAVFRHINDRLPGSSRILFGSCGNPGYLCDRDFHSDALFENRTLARLLEGAESPDDLDSRLRREGFTHLLFRFDCVFDPTGRKSEIPLAGQSLLAAYLNARARVVARAGPTFLYAVGRDDASTAERGEGGGP